jgi:hypothetical protein
MIGSRKSRENIQGKEGGKRQLFQRRGEKVMLRLILFRFNRIDIAANGGSGWVPLLLWGWRRRTTW